MAEKTFLELLTENSGILGSLILGGVIGALNDAVRKKPNGILSAVLEGIAAVGVGIAAGGLLFTVIRTAFGADEFWAAIAAGAVCSYFSDKILHVLLRRVQDVASGK